MDRKRRADEAGTDQGHANSLTPELGAERVEEAVQGVLGGRVGGAQGGAELPHQAGDDDEVAAAPLQHRGEERLGQGHGAQVVDLQQTPIHRRIGVAHQGALAHPAVVDHDLHRSEALEGALGGRLQSGGIRQVESQDQVLLPGALLRQRSQLLLTARRKDEAGAAPGQLPGERFADPRGGAGHPDHLARHVHRCERC